jgi:hypothetical protein
LNVYAAGLPPEAGRLSARRHKHILQDAVADRHEVKTPLVQFQDRRHISGHRPCSNFTEYWRVDKLSTARVSVEFRLRRDTESKSGIFKSSKRATRASRRRDDVCCRSVGAAAAAALLTASRTGAINARRRDPIL